MITSLHGDTTELLPTLAPGSVQMCATSPPYLGLRQYAIPPTAWPAVEYRPLIGLPPVTIPPMVCQLGAEPDPLSYIAHLVHVMRLVRPCLREDGTLFLNLADSYSSGTQGRNDADTIRVIDAASGRRPNAIAYGDNDRGGVSSRKINGIPDKNLLGIPARAALALQADGWVWRSEVIWHKPSGMPESVEDRFTRAHEMVYLFAKRPRYYFDQDAVREPHARLWNPETNGGSLCGTDNRDKAVIDGHGRAERAKSAPNPSGRNRRDVWTVATSPMPAHLRDADEAHYAAWPPALVEVMIKAGSANKACGACGAAYVRQVERETAERIPPYPAQMGIEEHFRGTRTPGQRGNAGMPNGNQMKLRVSTTGFAPACDCGASIGRCVVLDPFAGTGTTGAVAESLGRDSILIDLGYQDLQARRTNGIQINMESLL